LVVAHRGDFQRRSGCEECAPSPQFRGSRATQEPIMFKTILATVLSFCAAAAFAAVDVNKASQAELESIKGIGPSVSTRMLDERGKSPFASWSDLETRVKGVGPGNAAKFSAAGLTVNGAAYAAEARPAQAEKSGKPAKAPKAAAEKK
jgi:competence protein ComEA